ncbi:hypothetical protein I4U23_021821 [Adineta vaga]|nr:hypothetical protein I4U23_021821 [Adineta vaga]
MFKIHNNLYYYLINIFLLIIIEKIVNVNGLSTGNLLINGNFSQIESGGTPTNWTISKSSGNTTVIVIPNAYLGFNIVQISALGYNISSGFYQFISLEQNSNKTFLILSMWRKGSMIYSSAGTRISFHNTTNHMIRDYYRFSLSGNMIWIYEEILISIPIGASYIKFHTYLYNSYGTIFLTNVSVEQIDIPKLPPTFIVKPTIDGVLQLKWNFTTNGLNISNYTIYRSEGIVSTLNSSNFFVSFPSQLNYGFNVYESNYIDNAVCLNKVYTYQVLAFGDNGTILDKTNLQIGQAILLNNYQNVSILIALKRTNDIHLSWKLQSTSKATNVTIYNGINQILNIRSNNAQLIGTYPIVNMKAIVSLSFTGPYLLISDDGNDIATSKLINLTHFQLSLKQERLDLLRQQIQNQTQAKSILDQLIRETLTYPWTDSDSYARHARNAAFIYAITGNQTFLNISYSSLMKGKLNYTISSHDSNKLDFGTKTVARLLAFDWAYHGFTTQQRHELIKDFQYAAMIFSNYQDDHSIDNDDKASNWVAILKSAESMLHLNAYNEDDYPNDQVERRILFLLNEIKLHIDHSYGSSGYMQEGMGYITYTAIYHTKDVGISLLYEAWSAKDWSNFALHTYSLRSDASSLQFGVGPYQFYCAGLLPFLLEHKNDTRMNAAFKWLYDHVVGKNSLMKDYDLNNRIWSIIYYPYLISSQNPSIIYPQSTSLLIDNRDGFYAFRNRYQDRNDILIALENSHRKRSGWSQHQGFGFSIISHDTIWIRMPSKSMTNTSLFSTPIIDGKTDFPIKNGGYGKNAFAFNNQGGGYVSVDSSGNFRIQLAQREMFVDMIVRNQTETILGIYDQFYDNISHNFDWQLSTIPNEINNIILGYENNLPTFVINGKNGSWYKGWLYESQGIRFINNGYLIRINRIGFNVSFKIVLAILEQKGINISDVCIQFDLLTQGVKNSNSFIPIITGILGGFALLIIIIIIGICINKRIKKNNRLYFSKVKSMTSTEIIPALLSCRQLKDLLQSSSKQIAVLEADISKQVEADFKAGHIPKARYFDQLEYTTPTAFIPRGLPDVKSFEDYLTRLGISNEHHIVLYDRSPSGFFAASRAWFLFKTYGVDKLSILDGGFNAWKREINEIEKDESNDSKEEEETKRFTVKLNEKMVRNFDQMVSNISLDKDNIERLKVFDARPPNLFYGADAGHMPNAINLPYGSLFDQANQYLKSKDQLEEIFNKAGVDLSKPTIYTCQGGITASTLAFVADLLGQKEPSVYMGAFTEWQQRAPPELIIKGDGKPTNN